MTHYDPMDPDERDGALTQSAAVDPTERPGIPGWLTARRTAEPYREWVKPSRELHDVSVGPLTRDVAFNRHSINDGEHVSPFDNGRVQVGTDGIEVVLVQGIDEPTFRRVLSAATRATIGIDISVDGLEDTGDSDEMFKGGLQTALETQVIVFAVKGVSRTATHQLVRTRNASFHQQSQRASYVGDAPELRMPESVWVNKVARDAFLRSAKEAWQAYRVICEQDISYQDARFVLPEGTNNFILLEYNVREFLKVYDYRGCSMFQWEIVDVMRKCRAALVAAHPFMDDHVKISCERTGPVQVPLTRCVCEEPGVPTQDGKVACPVHNSQGAIFTEPVEHACTFMGWEDVEGQCTFNWARHEARTFKPAHHRISRKGTS